MINEIHGNLDRR